MSRPDAPCVSRQTGCLVPSAGGYTDGEFWAEMVGPRARAAWVLQAGDQISTSRMLCEARRGTRE